MQLRVSLSIYSLVTRVTRRGRGGRAGARASELRLHSNSRLVFVEEIYASLRYTGLHGHSQRENVEGSLRDCLQNGDLLYFSARESLLLIIPVNPVYLGVILRSWATAHGKYR